MTVDGQVGRAGGAGVLTSAQISRLVNNYKLTPATLMNKIDPSWIPAPFLQYISAEIARAVTQGSCGLLVSAPPRHGKSRLITIATPLWVLENFPSKNVIVATYGEDLSTDFTREVKDLIKSNQNLLSVRTRRDVDRASNFVTPQGGGLKAVGLRGTITGRGANVFIIDDYIKEPKEALSHDYLEGLKVWYATVARTRLEPGAVVIIVATRWVVNDLHGHIERLEARRSRKFYKQIRIQAIAGRYNAETKKWEDDPEHPDLLGRKAGTPLFPERYSVEALLDLRDELGPRWFDAMFQQNPSSEDSAVTNPANIQLISKADFQELLKRGHNQPTRFKRRRGWDFASTKNAGDYTAGPLCTWDTQTDAFYIEDVIHGQFSAGRVEQQFALANEADPQEVDYVLEQEPGSAGKFAAKHFEAFAKSSRTVRIVMAASAGSKLLKAQPFLAHTEKKAVYLVVDDVTDTALTPWVQKFFDEFIPFPEGGNDDIMDAVSSAYNDATGRKPFAGAWGRSEKAQRAQRVLNSVGELPDGANLRPKVTFGRTRTGKNIRSPNLRRGSGSSTSNRTRKGMW